MKWKFKYHQNDVITDIYQTDECDQENYEESRIKLNKDLARKYYNGYGYFIFDYTLTAPEILSFRTNIFPNEEEPITVYKEK